MRRWLLWTLVCCRGRLCADIAITHAEMPDGADLPEGALAVVEWACETCGTRYRRSSIIGREFQITSADRVAIS